MIGKYDITLYNNKIHYSLTVKRNLTILRGDSASGKSELIRLLSTYNSNPTSSGITLICAKKCIVLNEGNWKIFTDSFADTIFFIDEGNSFLKTKEFANTVKGSDNYFVIISREKLSQLPYSIDEIYGLHEGEGTGKYRNLKRVYNEMYKIFGLLPRCDSNPDLIITEDSNSGNDFFSIFFHDRCISSNGKSNIKQIIAQHPDKSILAVVDGAAFGSEMQYCMDIISEARKPVSIFAPESFEYLILRSGILEVTKTVIEKTWDYADSKKYFSWEEFYTHYLCNITRNGIKQYSKGKLNEFYKTSGNVDKIKRALPDYIKNILSR